MLSIIILVTALAGFGISICLLKLGVASMWMRYPVAVVGAYGIFLGLIRLWVEIERMHFDPNDQEIQKGLENDAEPYESLVSKSDSGWWDWLEIPDFANAEGLLLIILLGAIVAMGFIFFAIIGEAPILIAEVFVDAFLAGLLYRRLRISASEAWLGTAIRKTWVYVFWTAFLLCVAGLCLDLMATDSDTMGKAIKEILGWQFF